MTIPSSTEQETLLELFPPGTEIDPDGRMTVAGCDVTELADRFGTPTYVIDEQALRTQARRFQQTLSERWPNSRVVFASKAYPAVPVIAALAEEGVGADVVGAGELLIALTAGVKPENIVVHGNAKTDYDLLKAVEAGVGEIVIDSHDDIDRLEQLVTGTQHVLIRVLPDVSPETHESMNTGAKGSKFGLPLHEARRAIERLQASDKLVLDGLHAHIGSQILETEPFALEVERLAELGEFDVYDLGGGLGVNYIGDEDAPTPEEWIDTLTDAAAKHLPAHAQILIEPGRSMVARAGLTLYRVVTVKHGEPTFVAVDGGMGDNLDVALTGQPYTATVVGRSGLGKPVELVGRHCESGDKLISGIPLVTPVRGDIIAMPVTGAYSYTMANNYNGALRPPVVFCRDGEAREVIRRETYEDLLGRTLTL